MHARSCVNIMRTMFCLSQYGVLSPTKNNQNEGMEIFMAKKATTSKVLTHQIRPLIAGKIITWFLRSAIVRTQNVPLSKELGNV